MFDRSMPEPLYETLLTFTESQAVWDMAVTVLIFSAIAIALVRVIRLFLISKQGPTPLTEDAAYKTFKSWRP